jgi:hypothetical protein
MADYYSVIAKAVSALDLNTEKARLRLYERARTALRSEMHSAYPPFHRSQIAAAEMSLEMAIEAVEAEAVREQSAKLATLATSLPIRLRHTPATCWVRPVAGIKLGIGRRLYITGDAEQRAESVERVEAPVEAKREFVEVGL